MASRRVQKLATVVAGGDYRKSLEAVRDKLAAELDVVESTQPVAAVAKQLVDVLAKLAALPNLAQKSKVDELAEKRAARLAAAAVPKRSAGGRERGGGSGRASS